MLTFSALCSSQPDFSIGSSMAGGHKRGAAPREQARPRVAVEASATPPFGFICGIAGASTHPVVDDRRELPRVKRLLQALVRHFIQECASGGRSEERNT